MDKNKNSDSEELLQMQQYAAKIQVLMSKGFLVDLSEPEVNNTLLPSEESDQD